jgi:hypothetical protein
MESSRPMSIDVYEHPSHCQSSLANGASANSASFPDTTVKNGTGKSTIYSRSAVLPTDRRRSTPALCGN